MSARFGLGLAAALASGIAYGAIAPFATLAAAMGLTGADTVLWRAVVMLAASLLLVALLRRSLLLTRPEVAPVLALGAATAVTSIAYLSAVAYVPVAVAAVVFYTFPVLILIASPLVDGERITPPRIAVFTVAFLGILLVVGPGLGALDPRGLALAALASLGATVMMFLGNRVMRRTGAESASVWIHIVVVPASLAFVLAAGGPAPLPATAAFAFVFGVIATTYVGGFLLQLFALRHIPAVVAGLVYLSEPAVAILLAAVILGERLTGTQYLGCAVVFAALVASARVERRELARRRTA